MGTGLAIVCSLKGYPFVAVMSKGNSEERAHDAFSLEQKWFLLISYQIQPRPSIGGDLDLVDEAAKQITNQRRSIQGRSV